MCLGLAVVQALCSVDWCGVLSWHSLLQQEHEGTPAGTPYVLGLTERSLLALPAAAAAVCELFVLHR